MYELRKTVEISAAHSLQLPYESKCTRLHGHNWIITVCLRGEQLNESGMLMDFSEIKRRVKEPLDHRNLNEVLPFNPTAENIAKWVCEQLQPLCYRVEVMESRDNFAIYEK